MHQLSKRRFKVAALSLAWIVLPINAHPDPNSCSSIEKLEQYSDFVENHMAYGRCVIEEERDRIGVYFCFSKRIVGIQGEEGERYHGQISPTSDKFFFSINATDRFQKEFWCEALRDVSIVTTQYRGDLCFANFTLSVEGENMSALEGSSSVGGYLFEGYRGSNLWLGQDLDFMAHLVEGRNWYLVEGTCTKID